MLVSVSMGRKLYSAAWGVISCVSVDFEEETFILFE